MTKPSKAIDIKQTIAYSLLLLLSACGGGSDSSQGDTSSQTSAEQRGATIQAVSSVSVLANRKWQAGKLLNVTGEPIQWYDAKMADDGTIVVAYVQGHSAPYSVYAVVGKPGSTSQPITWSPPVQLNTTGNSETAPIYDSGSGAWNLAIAISPTGRAYVSWFASHACTTSSYFNLTNYNCNYIHGRAFDGKNWLSQDQVTDSPRNFGTPVIKINDSGDLAVLHNGHIRTGPSYSQWVQRLAVAYRVGGQSSFKRTIFSDWQLSTSQGLGSEGQPGISMTLDGSGGITIAGIYSNSTSTTYVGAVRGNTTGTFAATEKVSTVGRYIFNMASNPAGNVAFLIDRNGYTSAAIRNSGTWQIKDFPEATSLFARRLVLTSNTPPSTEYLYNPCIKYSWTSSANSWGVQQNMPSGCSQWPSTATVTSSNNGHQLWSENTGTWSTYDSSLNQIVQPLSRTASDYVLGYAPSSYTESSILGNVFSNRLSRISSTGYGSIVSLAKFKALPTATARTGTLDTLGNLWAWYLK